MVGLWFPGFPATTGLSIPPAGLCVPPAPWAPTAQLGQGSAHGMRPSPGCCRAGGFLHSTLKVPRLRVSCARQK